MPTDKNNRIYATGCRKTSVARVFLSPKGSGSFTVNGKNYQDYFPTFFYEQILEVFKITDSLSKFDIFCTVKGGGVTGQAQAIRHGIAKVLNLVDRDKYRLILKTKGFLTRDDRIVERKKYGLRKARKKEQYSKR